MCAARCRVCVVIIADPSSTDAGFIRRIVLYPRLVYASDLADLLLYDYVRPPLRPRRSSRRSVSETSVYQSKFGTAVIRQSSIASRVALYVRMHRVCVAMEEGGVYARRNAVDTAGRYGSLLNLRVAVNTSLATRLDRFCYESASKRAL